jgi:hypothetical protein
MNVAHSCGWVQLIKFTQLWPLAWMHWKYPSQAGGAAAQAEQSHCAPQLKAL